jgi:3-hydroxymyristoyl/3-hydroxydecanoyl-(acyl carrier protein) dehydratase
MRCAEFSWVVPPDHPALAGHFPGRPIVPGVVLIDRAIVFAGRLPGCADVCWEIANAKFLSPVGPGETLVFRLEAGGGGAISFSVRAGGRAVASGSLIQPRT